MITVETLSGKKISLFPWLFRKNNFTFYIPFRFSLYRGNMNNKWYNIKPFIITIKMKNTIDMYKIEFLNSALKHNVITNTNKNVKPCKLELWNGTSWYPNGFINGTFIILDLNSSGEIKKSRLYFWDNKINYITKTKFCKTTIVNLI